LERKIQSYAFNRWVNLSERRWVNLTERYSRTGKYEIWTINADASGLRQLTELKSNPDAPIWCPDPSQITFYILTGDALDGVFSIDPRKGLKEQVPLRLTDWFGTYSWSSAQSMLAGSYNGIVVYYMKTDSSNDSQILESVLAG
jgi:Tol biopolymer transport system component